ncbi:hypothetical protein ACIBJC_12160 [Streptomyces sp. NPDC050509]|uniref:hypothetical protein n=1 Tax=Streptomyces sp. NPDC050509 TaxID=3365620 RepID=UPI0037A4D1E9
MPTGVGMARDVRPRAMVLHEVWRELDGVGALSGPQGGPLSRTVKLVLDPLVIRPVLHPRCAGPLVTADGAALLATLVHAAGDTLRAAAAWFALLKRVRRELRITDGHPQDLYFQRCFELATTLGPPDATTGRPTAEETLREVHGSARGRTTRALREYVTDPAHREELASALEHAWADRHRAHPRVPATSGAEPPAVRDVLDACPVPDRGDGHDGGTALLRLVADSAGTAAGRALWDTPPEPGSPGSPESPVPLGSPGRPARELGLTVRPVPVAPGLGGSASTSTMGPPFDRTVHERVFSVLHASSDRAGLAPVPELVRREVARSCAPWALADESLRVAATVGTELALGLRPLGEDPAAVAAAAPTTEAHRIVNSRWRREAYVLQARRLALSASGAGSGSGSGAKGDSVAEPLARIAEDLRTPWRAYLRRLWVRLHGRDVREAPMDDLAELWDVLDGVARSVILDHRSRVRQALSTRPVPEGTV